MNLIVFSTVYREEREIITRYFFSFSFKKRKNSSVQRKLGSRSGWEEEIWKDDRGRGRSGGGGGRGGIRRKNCMTVEGCWLGNMNQYESNSLRVKESVSIRQGFFSLYAHPSLGLVTLVIQGFKTLVVKELFSQHTLFFCLFSVMCSLVTPSLLRKLISCVSWGAIKDRTRL